MGNSYKTCQLNRAKVSATFSVVAKKPPMPIYNASKKPPPIFSIRRRQWQRPPHRHRANDFTRANGTMIYLALGSERRARPPKSKSHCFKQAPARSTTKLGRLQLCATC